MVTNTVELEIQADEETLSQLETALKAHGIEAELAEVNGLDGSADIWIMVAQATAAVIGALTPLILGLIRNKKIKSVKIDGMELTDVSEPDAERLIKAKAEHQAIGNPK